MNINLPRVSPTLLLMLRLARPLTMSCDATGFFDTSKDRKRTYALKNDPKLNVNIADLDGERRDDIEARERKKDLKRQKLHKKTNLPAVGLFLRSG